MTIDPANLINLQNVNLFRLLEPAIFILLLIVLIFSLLMLRQAMQMTKVLPTPLSSPVKLAVFAYVGATLIAIATVASMAFM